MVVNYSLKIDQTRLDGTLLKCQLPRFIFFQISKIEVKVAIFLAFPNDKILIVGYKVSDCSRSSEIFVLSRSDAYRARFKPR